MEGFLEIRIRPWMRRMLTRLVAILPAVIVTGLYGESGISKLLIFSQVILSMQLSFAVIPLVQFTSDARRMGEFVNARATAAVAWIAAGLIAAANVWLILQALH
jgi:manganese transport protein